MLPYGRQNINDADIAAVVAALRSPMLTQGPRVPEFEERLADAVGARYAVAFNSATSALHAAYAVAGIGPGRSVLTSPITFVATANASLYLGGGVRFADVETETGLIDPAAVADIDDSAVRILAPVHFTGEVADLEQLSALAKRRGWIIVEDAAHALGASYTTRDGRTWRVGSCGHSAMCCFSFHPVKPITTGEGGAVTTNDASLAKALQRFRTHGITRDPDALLADEGPWYYEQQELGFNYRLTDIQAALGTSQLGRLGEFVAARRQVAAWYGELLPQVEGARLLKRPHWSQGAHHLLIVRVPRVVRRQVFEQLRGAGIGVNVHYIPVYRQPYYRANGFEHLRLPNAETYYGGAITLPIYPGLSRSDVQRVVQTLSDALMGCAV